MSAKIHATITCNHCGASDCTNVSLSLMPSDRGELVIRAVPELPYGWSGGYLQDEHVCGPCCKKVGIALPRPAT